MQTDRSICLIHLPLSVVDELFIVHDHQVSMQQRGIAFYSRDESMQKAWNYMDTDRGVPQLLRLPSSTNQFGKQ